jgi:hypothetical protein
MKKLLFLLLVIVMSSCTYNKVTDQTSVPNAVQQQVLQLDSTNLVNQYVIHTDDFDYVYNQDKQLIEKYANSDELVSIPAFLLLILVLGFLALLIIVSIVVSN